MRLIKTSIHRLEYIRDCGCRAVREYEDPRYLKALTEGTAILCEKHKAKSPDAQEMAIEMVLENLDMQAEMSSKQFVPSSRQVEPGDNAGVTATGESVQALGVTNLPNRTNRRRDPLAVTKMSVDRLVPRAHAAAATGSLNLASAEGVEFNEEIGAEAPENPHLSAYVETTLGGLAVLDQDDAETQGVALTLLDDGE
jgi:hypothetical protein